MVDREKIRRKIQLIEDNLIKLKTLGELSWSEFNQDFRNAEAAKHLLQVNIEAMIDIANHYIARNRWLTPESSSEAFRILAEKGLISAEDQRIFSQMIKFRNRIVHMYFAVDNEEIYRLLKEKLDDFHRFIKIIATSI